MAMTSDAKRRLSATIRTLRERLLGELHDATRAAYRLDIPRLRDAGLDEALAARRRRLEDWLDEQVRAEAGPAAKPAGKAKSGQATKKAGRSADVFLRELEQRAGSTLLNRLVVLRLMEAPGSAGGNERLRKPAVVSGLGTGGGGWQSEGYLTFRQLAPALVRDDPTEGYGFLLKLVFEELATELPGLFGPSVADLIPVPPATLRAVLDALGRPELESCWSDDMTLGWVYQYWNDPEREALDKKLNRRENLENHEIAAKTQMFTERYMVDWLLQNSLGPMWLAVCAKNGWTPEVVANGVLDGLEQRRIEWRAKREAGEVELTALMPLHSDVEARWAYFLSTARGRADSLSMEGEGAMARERPFGLPSEAVAAAPDSLRDLKLFDPAVGSGHFLVVALELLFHLYREEARHRGEARDERWSDRAIVERILEHNLHGLDLDPRAVQIAAAALWLKGQTLARGAQPKTLNLVASNLRLGALPDDDKALVELKTAVEKETGVPGPLMDTIIHALRGADHLGSLLKVDAEVEQALDAHEKAGGLGRYRPTQQEMFIETPAPAQIAFDAAKAKRSLLDELEGFLARHTGGDDLGLRLRGEQLAAGVRFVRMVREGTYHVVVANPPYQGTSKMADAKYVEKTYPMGKADLFAAFLMRGLELARDGGVSAMLTMRNWMFIKQYAKLREHLLATYDLQALGDFAVGAFDEVPNDVLSVVVSVFRRAEPCSVPSRAQQPTPPDDVSYDRQRTKRKRAATLCHVGRHTFDPAALKVVPEWPLVYWWAQTGDLALYRGSQPLAVGSEFAYGAITTNNGRYLRRHWEPAIERRYVEIPADASSQAVQVRARWVPYVVGAKGEQWIAATRDTLFFEHAALSMKVRAEFYFGSVSRKMNTSTFFRPGVSLTMIGAEFSARAHRLYSISDGMASCVFARNRDSIVCLLNSATARRIATSLNPTIHFELNDISRLPNLASKLADLIMTTVRQGVRSSWEATEIDPAFRHPAPSLERYSQAWAQLAVDRPDGAPLPPYEPVYDPEPPTDHLSFALGVALGRFGESGEGILDPEQNDLSHALPAGLLFLDRTLDDLGAEVATGKRALAGLEPHDGLFHPAAKILHDRWASHGRAIGTKRDLRDWLALDFFKDVHKAMYENRPIHWPLSSDNRTFVAWVNIHRWNAQTLPVLLADHLAPALTRLDGQLDDLREARQSGDKKAARTAEQRFEKVKKAKEELERFIGDVEQCADRGPLPPDAKTPPREQDAPYDPDLDDGVMVNSAALWKLLEPQWKDPKKWWAELAKAEGKKDYDWSHLAMRYFPTRVDAKCQKDPSLGVAHGCFWRYHPARAWAWELRLQDEIGEDFRIEEPPYREDEGDAPHRLRYLTNNPLEALEAIEKEAVRRMGRGKKRKPVPEMRILEEGFWAALPEEVYALELRLSQKQGLEFRLLAPDEPTGRATYENENPAEASRRRQLLSTLTPPELDLEDEEEPEDDDPYRDEDDEVAE